MYNDAWWWMMVMVTDGYELGYFWDHLRASRDHFGKNDEKGVPQSETRKIYFCLSYFGARTREDSKCEIFSCCKKPFSGVMKYNENWCQKGSNQRTQSDPETLGDLIFWDFEAFWEDLNFRRFWERNKSTPNLKQMQKQAPPKQCVRDLGSAQRNLHGRQGVKEG